jgi:rubrerythrin
MLEAIKTFFGRLRGRGETVVAQGFVWRCTQCNFIFLTRTIAEKHPCQDQKVN